MHTPNTVEFAFDKSLRTYDADGKLHVAVVRVTKAAVNPYRGNEIIGWQELGLDPHRVYQMLRHPDELAKPETVASFDRCAILDKHVPFNVETYDEKDVAGWLGSDSNFSLPYMLNSMTLIKPSAIAGVESKDVEQLSASYRYKADMTAGTYNGLRYDGIMRDIRANHVALVEAGRAGPDVVVSDSQLERNQMAKTPALNSRMALMANGALVAHLAPILAADAALNLYPVLKGVTRANFGKKKAAIASGVARLAKPFVAQDADLDGVLELLDRLDGTGNGDPDEDDITVDEDPMMMDADGLQEFLKGKLSPEDHQKACSMMTGKAADAAPGEEGKAGEAGKVTPPVAKDAEPPAKPEPAKPIDKPAMDAALARTRTEARTAAVADFQAIRVAEAAVRPYIGDVSPDLAMDSADAIYGFALESLGVDVANVHPSAYPAILKAQPIPGEKQPGAGKFAMDAALAGRINKRFPNASKVRRL